METQRKYTKEKIIQKPFELPIHFNKLTINPNPRISRECFVFALLWERT